MTGSFGYTSPPPSEKRNWLDRYLRLQEKWDREIDKDLREALKEINVALDKLIGWDKLGDNVRRLQLIGSRGSLYEVTHNLFKRVGDTVRAGTEAAAKEANDAMYEAEEPLLELLVTDPEQLEVLRRSLRQTSDRQVQAMMTRILKTSRPLSRRLYRSEALANQSVARVVNYHLARGSSARDMEKDVIDLVKPSTPGGVSMVAKRLARTEMNNAFHAQAIEDMEDRPWIDFVRWHLSGSHKPSGDECEANARHGLFPADAVPSKPHPNCFCYITPDVPDRDTFLMELNMGRYDEWIEQNT